MKCHYEILGIERNAEEKEIKNSYRKLALKYHPDKNLDDVDASKEQFLLVQQAYDVLSDQQDRAWYDNHREQILRGSQTNYEDSSLDLFQYFNVACYKGFGDDPNGFYATYGDVFDKIATEDIEFMDSPDEFEQIPKFGTSKSSYEHVVGPFYAYWQSYCTRKTYTWLCPHNVNEYRDRRFLREIEKESKRIAQKAKKERNDEIRALVAYIRKRDRRVQDYKKVLEQRAEQNRIKQQTHRFEQLKRNREAAEAMQNSSKSCFNTSDHEEQLRQMEQAYGSDSECDSDENELSEKDEDANLSENAVNNGHDTSEDDAEASDDELIYVDDLYCIACNKVFKNESSYQNHESSKKHRESIEKLKRKLQLEEKMFQKNNDDHNDASGDEHNQAAVSDDNEANADKVNHEHNDARGDEHNQAAVSDENEPNADEVNLTRPKKNKKSKGKKQVLICDNLDEDEGHDTNNIVEPLADVSISHTSDHENTWADDNKKGKRGKNKKSKVAATATTTNHAGGNTLTREKVRGVDDNDFAEESTKGKSKGKKGDKTVETSSADADSNIDVSHACATCDAVFDSKNKLFNHLKKTKHSVYLPKSSVKSSTENNSKKGKQK